MAWKITNRETQTVDGDAPQVTIVMDNTADAADLPTGYAAGSIALAAESGLPAFLMGPDGTWHAVD